MNTSVYYYIPLLIIGLVALWWSGDKAVLYSRRTSYLFGLSTFFIGFVIISISTGIPELGIAITSIFNKVPQLSVGDIIGSNFTDIALGLGIPSALFGTIYVKKSEYKDLIFVFILIMIVMGVIFSFGSLNSIHGVVLIGLYVVCLLKLWKSRHIEEVIEEESEVAREKLEEKKNGYFKLATIGKLFLSVVIVLVASQITVFSASKIAEAFGFSLFAIGSTVVAATTSIPEIVLSINAVRRKDFSLALGNAFGSVLEQGTLILGGLALMSPTKINIRPVLNVAPFMFVAFAIVGYGLIKREKLNRLEGALLLLTYIAFLSYQYLIHF